MTDVNKIIIKTCDEMALAMKRHGLLKDNTRPAFQKTEQALYNYKKFMAVIESKKEQIQEIEEHGIQQKSKSITSFISGGSYEIQSDSEKAEDKIQAIIDSIVITQRLIKFIDSALKKISCDPYFEIIQMKYFDGKTHEEISDYYEKDVSTITRNKNRLVNDLKVMLFSDAVINELYN